MKSRLDSLFKSVGTGKELDYLNEKGEQVKVALNGDIVLKALKDEPSKQADKTLV